MKKETYKRYRCRECKTPIGLKANRCHICDEFSHLGIAQPYYTELSMFKKRWNLFTWLKSKKKRLK